MKLLTKELLTAFEKQGDTSQKSAKDIKVIAKFFTPDGSATWYATDFLAVKNLFFGYVNLGDSELAELGYFSLDELVSIRGKLGLPIERDRHFGEYNLQEIIDRKGVL